MPGRGPIPKDPSTRVRRNKTGANLRVVDAVATEQPALPTRYADVSDGDGGTYRGEVDWPEATVRWWKMWSESPLTLDFTDADWSELEIAALLHAQFMEGDYKLAAELRLRTAKFGTTPEDRARLKIQFNMADEAEERTERRRQTSSKAAPKGPDPRLKLVENE